MLILEGLVLVLLIAGMLFIDIAVIIASGSSIDRSFDELDVSDDFICCDWEELDDEIEKAKGGGKHS